MSNPILLQNARGDGGAVTARAMDRNSPVAREFVNALLQMD
jgi:hypothetical protein